MRGSVGPMLMIVGGLLLLFGGGAGGILPGPSIDGPLWLVVVEESSQRGPDVTDLVRDTAWRESLTERDIRIRMYDVDQPAAIDAGYSDRARKAGLPAMIVVAADSGEVVMERSLPGDSDAVDGALQEIGR